MADNSANVIIQATGEIYKAATGTTAPTSAISTPHASFVSGLLGYIGEDGVTQSINSETTEIKAWQNGDVIRKTQTSHEVTFSFPMLEMNPVTMAAYYDNYTATSASDGVSTITGDSLDHYSWIIDVVDSLAKVRIYIPDGQITERGETVYAHGEATVFPVTITAFPVNSIKAYKYVDHDITASS